MKPSASAQPSIPPAVEIPADEIGDFLEGYADAIGKDPDLLEESVQGVYVVDRGSRSTVVVVTEGETLVIDVVQSQRALVYEIALTPSSAARFARSVARTLSYLGTTADAGLVGYGIARAWNASGGEELEGRVAAAAEAGGRSTSGAYFSFVFASAGAAICSPGALAAGLCAAVGGIVGGYLGERLFDAAVSNPIESFLRGAEALRRFRP